MKKIYILPIVIAICVFAVAAPLFGRKKLRAPIMSSSIRRLDSLEPTVRQLEKSVYSLKNTIEKLQKRVFALEKYLAPQKDSSPKTSHSSKNHKGRFPYRNVRFDRTPGSSYVSVIGEITNKSGKSYEAATFKISVYDSRDRLMGITPTIIYSFEQGQTKSFDALFESLEAPIHHYKIDFEVGV